ncbi:MAG: flagellar biosynthetic protein FliO [Treponema sp.]|jgi:flagellar protein FliO/FliZ|nr:flagellar biosynthetic protein FliO [Treponema sp.]
MPTLALLFLGAGFLALIPKISAQEAPAENPLRVAEQSFVFDDTAAGLETVGSSSSIWTVVRMVLTLALAAAAVYGVVFMIKKSAKRTDVKDPFLKILASAHLGSNRYAHVVSVGSKAWLLGSSDGGVNLIGEIDDNDILNAMLLEDSRKSAETAGGRLTDFISMLRRQGAPAESGAPGADEIRKRRERLKGL